MFSQPLEPLTPLLFSLAAPPDLSLCHTAFLSHLISKRLENDAKPWTTLKTISLVQENTADSIFAYRNVSESDTLHSRGHGCGEKCWECSKIICTYSC